MWRKSLLMKFATIGHLLVEKDIKQFPESWIAGTLIVSPELDIQGTKGYITGLTLTAQQMMSFPKAIVQKKILDAALFLQQEFDVKIIQLGALTTSVTDGGVWVAKQKDYEGFVNHGDSYTAAVTCQAVGKVLRFFNTEPSEKTIAIVGAYGIIGEAVSKILVPQFHHAILVGRRTEKLKVLEKNISGDFETTIEMKTKEADVVVTATSHPDALLRSEHLRKDAIVVDVSQPPNLSLDVCMMRPDVCRVDGGLVDFPFFTGIPGMPTGKNFACIVEVIMQAMEDERKNHVGSVDLTHLQKTKRWAEKYGFMLTELTNFGRTLE